MDIAEIMRRRGQGGEARERQACVETQKEHDWSRMPRDVSVSLKALKKKSTKN